MTLAPHHSKADELIRRLDEAVAADDDAARCRRVKAVLMDVVSSGEQFIPEALLRSATGQYARRQAGYTFAFDPPNGKTFVLRGAVDFKWTKGRRIVRTAHVITKGGHPNTKGADPKNYSSALCQIS